MFELPDDDIFWEDFPLEDADVDQAAGPSVKESVCSSTVSASECGNGYPHPLVSKALSNHNDFGISKLKADVENITPKLVKEGLMTRSKRKFPGPAGLLPPSTPSTLAQASDTPNLKSVPSVHSCPDLKDEICDLPLSQAPSDDVFTSASWKALLSDLGPDAQNILSRFAIKSMLIKASRKLLHRGKIPLIIGVMESLDMQGADASFVIRDTTGKMNGSLHRDLIKDPASAVQAGSVLVLRQVSVISPSNRTHYLNVTPGNVVLIYSTNKDAEVFKRSWSASPSSPTETGSCMKDSVEIPSLKQVIEESEQELTTSLRNLRQRLIRGSSSVSDASPLSSRIGQGRPFSSLLRFPSGVAVSDTGSPLSRSYSLFTSTPRSAPALSRPRQPSTPLGYGYNNSGQPKGSLFTTGFKTPAPFPQGQGTSVNESPHWPSDGTQNFRQHFSVQTGHQSVAVSTYNFAISGAKAIRNCSTATTITGNNNSSRNFSEGSGGQNFMGISPISNQSHQGRFPGKPGGAAACAETDMTGGRNRNKENNLVQDFDNDFPDDDDDHMIAQLCDEWSPSEDRVDMGPGRKCVKRDLCDLPSDVNVVKDSIATSDSVTKKQSERCRQVNLEADFNYDNPVSFKNNSAFLRVDSCHSDTGTSPVLQINTESNTLGTPNSNNQTSGFTKKFSFKRTQPASHSSSGVTPAKRPVCETNRNSSDSKMFSETSAEIPSSSSVESMVHVGGSSINSPLETCTLSTVQITGAKDYSIARKSGTGGNMSMLASSRDARVQLGRGGFGKPAEEKFLPKTSLPQWDDDLNDDLLLSQLCEEF